jgi:CDP-diacylglycerol--serine O-phosphatidyltransferase
MKIKLAYILPNFFTALSAFFGVMSVIAASQGKFEKAYVYILFSLVADGLDGRIARITNTTSKFGVEFDSLADLVAFGMAPAMMLFFAIGKNYGRFGALISGLFVVFGAIRLARFNVTTSVNDPRFFIGLPIPVSYTHLTLPTIA